MYRPYLWPRVAEELLGSAVKRESSLPHLGISRAVSEDKCVEVLPACKGLRADLNKGPDSAWEVMSVGIEGVLNVILELREDVILDLPQKCLFVWESAVEPADG